MMRSRGRVGPGRALRDEAGSLLLEVVVAAVLVGLIVGPLATALAGTVDRARDIQEQADSLPGPADAMLAGLWEWGPRVAAAWWRPGPVLHVKVAGVGQALEDVSIGLWADGWLRQEVAVPKVVLEAGSTEDLRVDAWEWPGMTREELVIRVRTVGGAWGPPWRSAIPDAAGDAPPLGDPSSPPAGVTAVVHLPQISTSELDVSWSAGALPSTPLGLLFALQPPIVGWGGATLDGRSQWWWMEEERDVDVYF